MFRPFDELLPPKEVSFLAPPVDELSVDEVFASDHVAERVHNCNVGRGPKLQVIISLDMRRAHKIDAARIDHDQFGAFAQPLLHARCEHRMCVSGVGADDQHHIGLIDALEVLRSGKFAKSLLQAVARW